MQNRDLRLRNRTDDVSEDALNDTRYDGPIVIHVSVEC